LLPDRAERTALMRLPTSWSLEAEDTARIRRAARTLLQQSPPYRKLLHELESPPR
jgi:hypothetical protein